MAAASPAAVRAEDSDDDDDAVEVSGEDVVEIIATTDAEDDPSATLDRITAEDMEASGARNAADALRLVPGVTIEEGARGESTLQVRGFDHRRVQVLLDGVPLSNPYDGGLDLASISTAQLEEIRVGRGAAGSAYGGGALGGVVDITTAGPPREPTVRLRGGGGSALHSELLASGGAAVGPVRASISWELRNRPHFTLPRSFPAQANETGGRRDNSDRRDATLHASVGVGGGMHQLVLRTTLMDVTRGVAAHIDDPSPRYWRWDTWREHLVSLHGRSVLSPRAVLRGAAFLRLHADVLDSFDDATYTSQDLPTSWSSTYRDTTAGGMAELELDLGRGSGLATTLSYRHDHHTDQANPGEPTSVRDGDSASLSPRGTIRIAEPLVGEVGVDLHLWQPRDVDEAEPRAPVVSGDPRLGLVLRPEPAVAVRLSGGRRSRFPTLKEMYSSQFGFVVPNPDLRPEHAWTVDGGVSVQPWQGRLVVGATGFYAHVQDLIERTTDADGIRSYTNVSTSRHAGIELRVVARPHPRLELEIGYDGLHARNTSDDRTSDLLEYRPEHRGRARVHVSAPFGLEASLVFTVVGPRPYLAVESTGEMDQLPSYTRLDLGLRQDLGRGFSIYLRGRNLYDTLYELDEGYPQPGIEVLGGLDFSGTAPM
jgi:outer membrane cobalamin receptor